MEESPDLTNNGEDFIKLPASNSPDNGSQPSDTVVKEEQLNGEILVINKSEHVSVLAENGDGSHKRKSNSEIDDLSGSKRPRITVDEQQASVHVIYNSITRESKRKLEELLQKWSEWHNRHHRDSKAEVELESGEGTYFPALNVGLDKPSALSFWMDGQTSNSQNKEVTPLDNNSVPLYDRGYSFGLTTTDGTSNGDGEMLSGSRCFNCGSYSHALKECTKPRDHAAVNSARKQHKSKRNQNSMNRNPTRYYQDTPGGKFDGLKPGVLDSETRKVLGLGELDPPPWLNRMREIGYPVGYLDEEEEEEASGIEIFGGDEAVPIPIPIPKQPDTEDGEILDMDLSPPPPPATSPPPPPPPPTKKMTVQFPGVNAPIPDNADEWRWGPRAWNFHLPRNRPNPNNRSYNHNNHNSNSNINTNNNSIEHVSRSYHHEERWNRDEAPPGVDPGSGGGGSGFSPRFSDYESRGSSYHHRSMSERIKRSPLVRETSSSRDDDRWDPYADSSTSSSHRKDNRHDEGHHRSWR